MAAYDPGRNRPVAVVAESAVAPVDALLDGPDGPVGPDVVDLRDDRGAGAPASRLSPIGAARVGDVSGSAIQPAPGPSGGTSVRRLVTGLAVGIAICGVAAVAVRRRRH